MSDLTCWSVQLFGIFDPLCSRRTAFIADSMCDHDDFA